MLIEATHMPIMKYNNKTIHIEECDGKFIILNDNTYIEDSDLYSILELLESKGYPPIVLGVNEMILSTNEYIKKNKYFPYFDMVILVGEGGSRVFEAVKDDPYYKGKFVYPIKWSRFWHDNVSNQFITDIEKLDLKNKKILLIEDVIASGNTIYNLQQKIEQMGGEVIGIMAMLIQETSPLAKDSFIPMIIGAEIKTTDDKNLDPFWFPPIYSLRHLLYGDDEVKEFYKIFNEKYFNNDEKIEIKIKEIRKKYERL